MLIINFLIMCTFIIQYSVFDTIMLFLSDGIYICAMQTLPMFMKTHITAPRQYCIFHSNWKEKVVHCHYCMEAEKCTFFYHFRSK